jgi:DNA modification methylase
VILQGDCLEVMRTLPSGSVHCCITSPPYFALRDYGVEGQLGLERTPEEYIAKMVKVFAEVKRVLRDDGTLWLNMGDSYMSGGGASRHHGYTDPKYVDGRKVEYFEPTAYPHPVMKPKDLCGIPWMLAFALRADGWYLRQDIIWAKPNPMPESVTDRCTKSHEYIFLMSKKAKYYYDNEAVKESAVNENMPGTNMTDTRKTYAEWSGGNQGLKDMKRRYKEGNPPTRRNRHSVWTIVTHSFSGAHFATFPPKLVEPCILAGTSERGVCAMCGKPWERVVDVTHNPSGKTVDWPGWPKDENGNPIKCGNPIQDPSPGAPTTRTLGWKPACKCNCAETKPAVVFDPFGGAGTVGLVAKQLLRDYLLIELNPKYVAMAQARIDAVNPLFGELNGA